ncbi:TonB-dependent receptor [Mucilaginibacter hurinus]|uniref:TonB-dependent receptor n=1 Tax=Mucilaginibacter hurinus TaxID=2201324 RepID=A0A367GLI5_9SPHI|nr:TonB-dependent receptor [Mucilaginibacter hurinus]RCH53848.1 TonB-dependent receptor [Mucilaginibacter hurinus]
MQIKKIFALVHFCAITLCSFAQQPQGSVKGTIHDKAGEALPAITVKLTGANFSKTGTSDLNGAYAFTKIPSGNYTVTFRAVGFEQTEINTTVTANKESTVNVALNEASQGLQTVQVTGRTAVQEINRLAFNVTAVDAKQLYNTTLDLSSALDRVSGIRVRESGGVGSTFNLSLNGFSGNRVRYFIDGVPMDNFGSSFQINNIPINIADRVEVYKGVVPIWLGSDALGGAINIVTGNRFKNYVDASYSYGSFNTHRSVINAAVTNKKGFTFRLNAFQNYSDNSYKVTVEAADINTKAYNPKARLRRFHDNYHNETLIANVGVVGKSWADQLLLGVTLGQNYKEFQTSVRMNLPYGSWHRRGNIVMPSLKYSKLNLIKGLDITVNGNYNLGTEQNIDTVAVEYDWYGNSKPKLDTNAGERSKSLSRYKNNNGLLSATANYKLSDNQNLALSNVFNTFTRTGRDTYSVNFLPGPKQKVRKNVLGLAYSFNERDKWSVSLFGKYLHQKSAGQNSFNRFGFGAAASLFLSSQFQLKASYEKAQRLPEANELFGDMELQVGNASLNPEESNNANLGMSYSFNVNRDHHFLINANATYRYSNNYIYTRFNQNQTALMLDNTKGVFVIGGEGEMRYSYKKWLSAGTTLTYQFLQNKQDSVLNQSGVMVKSSVYNDQMPNIPYFFGNADITVTLRDFKGKGNTLNLGYNLLYVHAFWLYWPSAGGRDVLDEKYVVPMQLSHDLSAVYSFKSGRYNVGLEVRNITDTNLYDNFSLQKPGRGFYLNFRYFFNSFKI